MIIIWQVWWMIILTSPPKYKYIQMENNLGERVSVTKEVLDMGGSIKLLEKSNLSLQDQLFEGQIAAPLSEEIFKQMILLTTIFVDKTLFIQALLRSLDNGRRTFIITRPRRWGKSLMLSMLYYFFIDTQNTKFQQKQYSFPYKYLFEGGNVVYGKKNITLKKLKIAQQRYRSFWNKYQGKFPVIWMNWSGIKPKTFQEAFKGIRLKIAKQFKKFNFVIQKLSEQERQTYNQYQNSEVDLEIFRQNSLPFLCECLWRYYGEKAVILIDEYDHSYNHMLSYNVKIKEKRPTEDFLNILLQFAFKHNQYLECGIATGLYDIMSDLNNTKKDTIASPFFVDAYGLSKYEIQQQLIDKIFKDKDSNNQSQMSKKQLIMDNIQQWYNGYCNISKNNVKYYNPFSVINYLYEKCIQPKEIQRPTSFWTRTSNTNIIEIILSSSSKHQLLGKMLELNQVPGSQPVFLYYNTRANLTQFDQNIQSSNESKSYISYLLLHTGYITGTFIQNGLLATLPNFEIYQDFRQNLKSWMKSKWNIAKRVDLTNSTEVRTFLQDIYHYFKKNLGTMNEKSFNSLFYIGYMMSGDPQTHVVNSQHSPSPNYIDHIFHPKQGLSEAIVIHEFKYQENSLNREKMSQKALWQIFQKDYMNFPLSEWGGKSFVKKIIVRGITITLDNPLGKRQMSIHMSRDHVFSFEQANKISQFFKSYRHQKQMLEKLQKNFFSKLKNSTNKNLLYDQIIKIENEEKEKEKYRPKPKPKPRKKSRKSNLRCGSEEEIEIFERSLEFQEQNAQLDISDKSEEQEDEVKVNFQSEEKIKFLDQSQNEVQWEEVNISSFSEDKVQQVERSLKKVTVEDAESSISSQSEEEEEVQFLDPLIEQDLIKKVPREGGREKLYLPAEGVSLKKRTAYQFSFTRDMLQKNLNNPIEEERSVSTNKPQEMSQKSTN